MAVMREELPDGKHTLRFKSFLDTPERGDFSEEDKNKSEIIKTFDKVLFTGRGTLNTLLRSKNFRKLFNLNESGGLYMGDEFVGWLEDRLRKKGYRGDETFETFEARNGTDMTVVAADTTAQEELVLNRRTAPRCPVVSAVRMSMSIPLIWREVSWEAGWGPYNGAPIEGHIIVDGGLVSNFPLDLITIEDHPQMNALEAGRVRRLGFMLDEGQDVPDAGGGPPRGPTTDAEGDSTPLMVKRVARLIDTMRGARDLETVGKFKANVCRLPARSYGVVEFDMPHDRL